MPYPSIRRKDQLEQEVDSALGGGQQIQEARTVRPKENLQTQKDEIPNMDERQAQARAAGNTQKRPAITETITRERPKIGRNERVTIKNVMSGLKNSAVAEQKVA